MLLAALGEAVSRGLEVGSVGCTIDAMVVCAHNDGTVVCMQCSRVSGVLCPESVFYPKLTHSLARCD
jgi:hypothetical protein